MDRRSFLKITTGTAATLAIVPHVQAAEPKRRITVALESINIRKQHDRFLGKGVDIYPAYFFTNAKGGYTGFGKKRNNLKNGTTKLKRDIFSVSVANDQLATFDIFMMEADGTNEKIKKTLNRLRRESAKLNLSGKFDEYLETSLSLAGVAGAVIGASSLGSATVITWTSKGVMVGGIAAAAGSPITYLVPGGLIIAGIFVFARFAPGRDDDLFGVWRGMVASNKNGSAVKIGIAPAEKRSKVEATTPVVLKEPQKRVLLPKATFRNDHQDLDYIFSARFE